MPSQELGASAYRKYDMEAWLPAKQFWGEVSNHSFEVFNAIIYLFKINLVCHAHVIYISYYWY